MKKKFPFIVALTILLIASVAKAGDSEIKIQFDEWLIDPDSKTQSIQFYDIDDLISPKDISLGPEDDDTFAEGIFDSFLEFFDYSITQDLDGDGIQEIIVLFIEGSLRSPSFYILKRNDVNTKYQIALFLQRRLKPVIFNKSLYFIETTYEFNSKRKLLYNILNFDKSLTPETVVSFKINYNYNLDDKMDRYISSEVIDKIADFDYSFLGVNEKYPNEFIVDDSEYRLEVKFNWTSVGYFATTMDIYAINRKGNIQEFSRVWGFTIKKINGIDYLSILDIGFVNRVSAITNFRITVYNMHNWSEVASQYLYANESITELN